LQRTLAWAGLGGEHRARLEKTMADIRPGALYKQIAELSDRLENLALAKAPAPVKPSVNRAFVNSAQAEVLIEATMQTWRRI